MDDRHTVSFTSDFFFLRIYKWLGNWLAVAWEQLFSKFVCVSGLCLLVAFGLWFVCVVLFRLILLIRCVWIDHSFFLVRSPAIHNELDTYGATTQSIHLLGLIHSPTCCCRFHTILWLTTTWYLNIVGNFPKDKIIPVFLGKSSVHFRARSSQ